MMAISPILSEQQRAILALWYEVNASLSAYHKLVSSFGTAQQAWRSKVGAWQQLGIQVFAVIIAIGYAVVGTLLLVFLIDKIFGLKSTPEEEMQGLDHSYHGERGYGMLNPN